MIFESRNILVYIRLSTLLRNSSAPRRRAACHLRQESPGSRDFHSFSIGETGRTNGERRSLQRRKLECININQPKQALLSHRSLQSPTRWDLIILSQKYNYSLPNFHGCREKNKNANWRSVGHIVFKGQNNRRAVLVRVLTHSASKLYVIIACRLDRAWRDTYKDVDIHWE